MDTNSTPDIGGPVRNRPRAVLLLGALPNQHNFSRIGISRLREVFDLMVLDLNHYLGRYQATGVFKPAFQVTEIHSLPELEQKIGAFRPSFALDFIGIDAWAYLEICKILARAGTDLVVVKDGPVPSPGRIITLIKGVSAFVSARIHTFSSIFRLSEATPTGPPRTAGESGILKKAETLAWAKLQRRIKIIGVFAGSKSFDINSWFVGEKIWAASEDFHKYNARIHSEAKSSGKIIFVDSPVADGSDWVALGRAPLIAPESYYPMMRNLFTEIEKASKLQIFIAGHPNHRENKEYKSNMGNRSILFDQTPELIRNSFAVISHGSTAISYAVLAKKPILFVNSKQLSRSPYGEMMRKMARLLKRPIISADSVAEDIGKLLNKPVNGSAYENYQDGFLKRNGILESNQWDAFIEFALKKYSLRS